MMPRSVWDRVMTGIHRREIAGHLGQRRAIRRCQEFFYWPDFRRDITR